MSGAGAGDCEDYAIAKFVALQEAEVSADDLRIVILRDDIREEDHAVVAARLGGNWLLLDNLHMVMDEDQQVRDYYRPIFLIDRDGVKLYSGASSTHEGSRGHERAVGRILRPAILARRDCKRRFYVRHNYRKEVPETVEAFGG